MKYRIILFLAVTVFASSCGNGGNGEFLAPKSTGTQGRIMVIMNKTKWEGKSGDTLKSVMQEEILGLPQPEVSFALTELPHNAFSTISKRDRNLLIVTISESQKKTAVHVEYDKWAKPQIVVSILARTEVEFQDVIAKNGPAIRNYFIEAERERLLKTYRGLPDKKIREALKRRHHLDMDIPQGFKLDVDSPHFVWLSRETPKLTQAILIWDYVYTDTAAFNLNNLVYVRDSVTMNMVPGPEKGSFMTTEKRMPIHYSEFQVQNRYTAELRGLWKTEGAFLGGPFVSHSTVDTLRNRIVTVDGFVYAGKQNKRNYMRQLEAIMSSLKFVTEEKIEKK